MGGSRWSFSKHAISSFVDLKTPVFSEIKPIKEGHYDLASASDEQLQKIATGVIQPYINKKISITVNDKTYPIKVNKIIRGGGNDIYTIWISVDHVDFNKPVNEVKIVYSLLLRKQTINTSISPSDTCLTLRVMLCNRSLIFPTQCSRPHSMQTIRSGTFQSKASHLCLR
jgi:hypothetical protein